NLLNPTMTPTQRGNGVPPPAVMILHCNTRTNIPRDGDPTCDIARSMIARSMNVSHSTISGLKGSTSHNVCGLVINCYAHKSPTVRRLHRAGDTLRAPLFKPGSGDYRSTGSPGGYPPKHYRGFS